MGKFVGWGAVNFKSLRNRQMIWYRYHNTVHYRYLRALQRRHDKRLN